MTVAENDSFEFDVDGQLDGYIAETEKSYVEDDVKAYVSGMSPLIRLESWLRGCLEDGLITYEQYRLYSPMKTGHFFTETYLSAIMRLVITLPFMSEYDEIGDILTQARKDLNRIGLIEYLARLKHIRTQGITSTETIQYNHGERGEKLESLINTINDLMENFFNRVAPENE